ncbi:DUF1573 domain-containing protein [Flavobacteriaceae bacterium Ap0902]|nr:DUF1573 domain-containing protein [Flavobacteriaceae bacterium Ap0902]
MKIVKLTFIALVASLAISCDQKSEATDAATVQDTSVVTEDGVDHTDHAHTMAENQMPAVSPEEAPVMALEEDVYDYGDVQAGSKTERVIEFTNTGKTPLLIQSASATCGCTVPEYSKEPVAPGEKGQLTVSFSAPPMNGLQTKTVTLNTNTAKKIETFRIKANVVGGNDRSAQPGAPAPSLPQPNLGNVN